MIKIKTKEMVVLVGTTEQPKKGGEGKKSRNVGPASWRSRGTASAGQKERERNGRERPKVCSLIGTGGKKKSAQLEERGVRRVSVWETWDRDQI